MALGEEMRDERGRNKKWHMLWYILARRPSILEIHFSVVVKFLSKHMLEPHDTSCFVFVKSFAGLCYKSIAGYCICLDIKIFAVN